jgi:hypothetical protein
MTSRRMRWAGHVVRMVAMRNAYAVLVGKLEGKRALRKPRCRCEDNIKMSLRKMGFKGVEWVYLAKDRDLWRALGNAVMNLRVL